MINAIKFAIEEIEASDQYFDHTGPERGVEPPTSGLGNRFAHQYIKYSCPNVANMLHPLLCHKLLIT